MKLKILIVGIFILNSVFSVGQNKLMFKKEQNNANFYNSKSCKKLQSKKAVNKIERIGLDLNTLVKDEEIDISFFNKNFKVKKERITVRNLKNYSWVGKLKGNGHVLLTVKDDDIQGVITIDNEIYLIYTLENNEYAIAEINQTKYPQEKCYHHSDNTNNIKNDDLIEQDDKNMNLINETNTPSMLKSGTIYECKIRVLVLFTPAASSSVSDIFNTIQLAVDETNQSFLNSDVGHEIELVYAEETSYTEVDIQTDLDRFVTDADGFMDEVHDLRNTYSADICVLLNDDASWCGWAEEIQANESEAFCVVKADGCATGNYSFAHEIGHLLGCRHDTHVDSNNTPFAYGHGFVNVTDGWRTIMAYNRECTDAGTSCTRLQYWSNPDITWGGDAMGTTATNDCARVWDEEGGTAMAFRQPEDNVVLTNNDILDSDYADVIAKQNIETSGNITVQNGSQLHLRAGNSIMLQPGFKAELGSEFSASIEQISDCGTTKKSGKINETNSFYDKTDTKTNAKEVSSIEFNCYPNPSDDFLNVMFTLKSEGDVSIILYDFLGNPIRTLLDKEYKPVGSHSLTTEIAGIKAGIYFVLLRTKNSTLTKKLIINQ